MSAPTGAVALLALLLIGLAAAVPLYERPLNGDCIDLGSTTISTDLQLYPNQYILTGDGTSSAGSEVTVRL